MSGGISQDAFLDIGCTCNHNRESHRRSYKYRGRVLGDQVNLESRTGTGRGYLMWILFPFLCEDEKEIHRRDLKARAPGPVRAAGNKRSISIAKVFANDDHGTRLGEVLAAYARAHPL